MMRVSEHFTLEELVTTSFPELQNQPTQKILNTLQLLCAEILEPVRALAGGPIRVHSAYRSARLNAYIKGAPTSQHLKGQAADISPAFLLVTEELMGRIFAAHQRGELKMLGQAIIYPSNFIHLSIDLGSPRGQFLRSKAPRGSGGPYEAWSPSV